MFDGGRGAGRHRRRRYGGRDDALTPAAGARPGATSTGRRPATGAVAGRAQGRADDDELTAATPPTRSVCGRAGRRRRRRPLESPRPGAATSLAGRPRRPCRSCLARHARVHRGEPMGVDKRAATASGRRTRVRSCRPAGRGAVPPARVAPPSDRRRAGLRAPRCACSRLPPAAGRPPGSASLDRAMAIPPCRPSTPDDPRRDRAPARHARAGRRARSARPAARSARSTWSTLDGRHAVRDITVDAAGEEHGAQIAAARRRGRGRPRRRHHRPHVPDARRRQDRAAQQARRCKTRDDLSMAYTPGVARVCTAIAAGPRQGLPVHDQAQHGRRRLRRHRRARPRRHRPARRRCR